VSAWPGIDVLVERRVGNCDRHALELQERAFVRHDRGALLLLAMPGDIVREGGAGDDRFDLQVPVISAKVSMSSDSFGA